MTDAVVAKSVREVLEAGPAGAQVSRLVREVLEISAASLFAARVVREVLVSNGTSALTHDAFVSKVVREVLVFTTAPGGGAGGNRQATVTIISG